MNFSAKALLSLVIAFAVVVGLPSPGAAGLISTSQAIALEQDGQARAIVDAYLVREEVAAELAALGVDPELARVRAAALSGAELEALAGRIQGAPAGGDGVITVLGVTFLVLLILELVGVIDIFKKI
jgi:hypothetical protein